MYITLRSQQHLSFCFCLGILALMVASLRPFPLPSFAQDPFNQTSSRLGKANLTPETPNASVHPNKVLPGIVYFQPARWQSHLTANNPRCCVSVNEERERARTAVALVHFSGSISGSCMYSGGLSGKLHAEGFLPSFVECIKVNKPSALTTTLTVLNSIRV